MPRRWLPPMLNWRHIRSKRQSVKTNPPVIGDVAALTAQRGGSLTLIAHCEARGIGFFSTAFDLESLDFLARLGAERFKVPSGEITNLPTSGVSLVQKDVIMSTGMAELSEIEGIGCLRRQAYPKTRSPCCTVRRSIPPLSTR